MAVSDWLSSARTNVVSGIALFPAVDVEGVAKRLRIRERATEDGSKGLPPSDSTSFDALEQTIVTEIENEGKTQLEEYLERQKTYAARAHHAGLDSLSFQLGAVASDAEGEFEKATRVGTGDLFNLRRDVIDAETDLRRFRSVHGLQRPARNRSPLSYHVGFLVLILAIEALLNGYFLAKGNTFGYLGGVTDAILIAALNIIVGVAAGRFVIPWLWYRSLLAKLLAAAGTLIYIAAALGFNIAVMHYRNALAVEPFTATAVAYQTLLSAPLDVHDLQSWQLFVLGVVFSLAAAVDGLRMDDPYPGFGRRVKEFEELSGEYVELKEELLSALEDVEKRAEAKMDDLTRAISSRRSELEQIATGSRSLRLAMLEHFRHLEGAANTLLQMYRSENARLRNTPSPKHFGERWTYSPPSIEGEVVQLEERTATDEGVRSALSKAPAERERLHASYRKAKEEYLRLDTVVESAPA
jgi:hypothetical protein